ELASERLDAHPLTRCPGSGRQAVEDDLVDVGAHGATCLRRVSVRHRPMAARGSPSRCGRVPLVRCTGIECRPRRRTRWSCVRWRCASPPEGYVPWPYDHRPTPHTRYYLVIID